MPRTTNLKHGKSASALLCRPSRRNRSAFCNFIPSDSVNPLEFILVCPSPNTSVLNNEPAIEVNITVMRVFVQHPSLVMPVFFVLFSRASVMLSSVKKFAITHVLDRLARALPHNAKYYLLTHSLAPERHALSLALNRELLAYIYVRGEGLELGALNNPLPVSPHAQVRYVDFATAEAVAEQFPAHAVKTPDIVDDAVTLASVEDCSQDFVIACHILEHLEDPIGAIKTWFRVLKPGGVLFMSIPTVVSPSTSIASSRRWSI